MISGDVHNGGLCPGTEKKVGDKIGQRGGGRSQVGPPFLPPFVDIPPFVDNVLMHESRMAWRCITRDVQAGLTSFLFGAVSFPRDCAPVQGLPSVTKAKK